MDELGADAVLMVSLAKLEELSRGNLKVVSARDSAVIAETSGEASGQKGLRGALEEGAKRLAEHTPGLRQVPPGTRRLGWLPALVAWAGAVTGAVGLASAHSQDAPVSLPGLSMLWPDPHGHRNLD